MFKQLEILRLFFDLFFYCLCFALFIGFSKEALEHWKRWRDKNNN